MTVKPRATLWGAIREAGLNQKRFAAMVGEQPPTVSRVVTGHLNIDENKQLKWARVLGKSVEELFSDGSQSN